MGAHQPVLLNEVLESVNVDSNAVCIDGTFGRGGHARALLDRLGADGLLIACDRDIDAVTEARELAARDARVRVLHAAFSELATRASEFRGRVGNILLDIGTSSPQLDEADRGFSFRTEGPLDMRMDTSRGVTAAEWLAAAPEAEIADVLWRYGEERRSRRIAARIVERRAENPIETTTALAELVRACVPRRGARIDSATRTFQALRIRVNDELGELERALQTLPGMLTKGGRLQVIAFHSLEDRMVKQAFRAHEDVYREARRAGTLPSPCFHALTRKPIMAAEDERAANPRARSARLRVLERVA